MSARSQIVDALVEQFKNINGQAPYNINIFDNCYNKHKFWDEVTDFPSIYVVAGKEDREYQTAGFKWGYLGISIKVYVKQEEPQEQLEKLLSDIELVIDNSYRLTYGPNPGEETAEIRITSIVTDEGLLVPYGIGEVNINVQYQVL